MVIYVPSYTALSIRKPADRLPPTPPPAAEEGPRLQPLHSHPSYLTALSARDGTVLWRREGWKPPGSETPPLARAGDVLITDALAREIGEREITALDRSTGETRWACAAGEPSGYARRLLGVRGGRVYVSKGGLEHYRLHVLDARSGEELWTLDQVNWGVTLSSGGKLVALTVGDRSAMEPRQLILDAADGTVVAEVSRDSTVHALTDDGIAYLSSGRYKHRRTRAVRLGDGVELWSISEGVPGEMVAGHVIATETALYAGQLTQPQELAEVVALDTRTGHLLWRWHSPAHLLSLLKLWGRHTPAIVVFALAQARRSFISAREARDRSILLREVIHGQWRRPGALIGGVQLAADRERVYVATNLGLFAVSASSGRLRWHALPTRDLSPVEPALPLEE